MFFARVTNRPAEHIYAALAPLYDLIYGAALQPGRRRAMSRLAPRGGERILEVGVGTGFGLLQYPADCRITAIDLSEPMIARACERLRRHRLAHVSLSRMDAARLAFADAQFDGVYAPYLINVVPDPVGVAREMIRVCRPGGRIVFLNHFDRVNGEGDAVNRLVGRMAKSVSGVNWDLDFREFVASTGLVPRSVEAVNIPPVSSVVVCHKA
jgi:phosphatidylethanolamine/phosphatidyl-N-methylethanolamine N-methyltransferase